MDRNDIIAYLTKKGYTGLHLYPSEDLLELYQNVVAESRKDTGPKLFNKLVPRNHLKAAQEQHLPSHLPRSHQSNHRLPSHS